MDKSVGFFSSFNARHLDAAQVARSFVPSAKFTALLGIQHALLVGARGSGKTHMLKMLQPKALNIWNHDDADGIRKRINYWGVFVPADEAWRQQIKLAADQLPSDLQSKFSLAVFSTHVQRALIDCFLQLVYDRPADDRGYARVLLSAQQESELCATLATSWKLTPTIFSLISIRQALVDRAADLYEAAESVERAIAMLEICQTQAVQAVLRGVNAFDGHIKRFEGRWCLMFDELELAPVEIQDLLFRSLRSSDPKLLFKLALSPSTQAAEVFHHVLGPTLGNDFDEISLYSEPKEAAYFCEQLWRRLTEGIPSAQVPTSVLGSSTFHAQDAKGPYSQRGKWQQASSRLAAKDPSYRRLLARYSIDPDFLDAATPQQKDAVVRKIGPIVGFREFFFKQNAGGSRSFRNDKSKPSTLYSGWEVLCLVSEGNPRWFTGIVKQLLITRDKTVSRRDLSTSEQYDALIAASRKFMDYIATIPSPEIPEIPSREGGLKSLVDFLVTTFRDEVLYRDFVIDPVLTFSVDESISNDLRQAIFDGLYAGAFIPVDDESRRFAFSQNLNGQRLRTTYLIAPKELLPLRSGKSRSISTLLGKASQNSTLSRRKNLTVKEPNSILDPQTKLFNE
ncbi:MAG: hypothetical protein JWN23_936 [Rhodocyclales bacterium]|nr:hypothetical protein [Rhodocyclales bacterium]